MILAVVLVLLHSPDGFIVEVNPEQVTSLRAPRQEKGERFAEGAKCMIGLTDGKFAAVKESCETVKKLVEEAKK